jgi:hypothetical protein
VTSEEWLGVASIAEIANAPAKHASLEGLCMCVAPETLLRLQIIINVEAVQIKCLNSANLIRINELASMSKFN